MLTRIAILALAALVLTGCGTVNRGDNRRQGGGCGAHTTF